MKMPVMIEQTAEGRFTASVLSWPLLSAHGASEQEALNQLRQQLTTQLREAKLTTIEVAFDSPELPNPWLQLGDTFHDNPLLDEVASVIAAYRRDLVIEEEAQAG